MPILDGMTASKEQELERLSRALRTLSGSNRALLRADEEQALLQEICRVVVEEAGYSSAVVIRAEYDERKSGTPVARFGPQEAYDELRDLTWDDNERGRSASSIAIRTGQPCVVNDVDNSPLSEQWRAFLRRHGFGAVLSLPLRVDGIIFGALTILAPEPDAFDELEMAPLAEAALDLAFGLQTLSRWRCCASRSSATARSKKPWAIRRPTASCAQLPHGCRRWWNRATPWPMSPRAS